jgi:hypothetical protein
VDKSPSALLEKANMVVELLKEEVVRLRRRIQMDERSRSNMKHDHEYEMTRTRRLLEHNADEAQEECMSLARRLRESRKRARELEDTIRRRDRVLDDVRRERGASRRAHVHIVAAVVVGRRGFDDLPSCCAGCGACLWLADELARRLEVARGSPAGQLRRRT